MKARAAYVPADYTAPAAGTGRFWRTARSRSRFWRPAVGADSRRVAQRAALPSAVVCSGDPAAGQQRRDAMLTGTQAVRSRAGASPGRRVRRSRLHPVHVRLHRRAQRRDADARERPELRRLVLGGVRSRPERSVQQPRAVSFRPLGARYLRPAQARRHAVRHLRGARASRPKELAAFIVGTAG